MEDDSQNPYDYDEGTTGEKKIPSNTKIESNGRRNEQTPLDIANIMKSLKVDMQSCKVDDERLAEAWQEKIQLNDAML